MSCLLPFSVSSCFQGWCDTDYSASGDESQNDDKTEVDSSSQRHEDRRQRADQQRESNQPLSAEPLTEKTGWNSDQQIANVERVEYTLCLLFRPGDVTLILHYVVPPQDMVITRAGWSGQGQAARRSHHPLFGGRFGDLNRTFNDCSWHLCMASQFVPKCMLC